MLVANYPPFRPSRRLPKAHFQTVGAFLLPGRVPEYRAVKRVVPLPDGDRLVVHDDQPNRWITGDRIVIMLHGLCGCHGSPYMRRTAEKLRRAGLRVFRVDMRGFGDSELISRSHLHGGCSPDLQTVIEFVRELSPLSSISLVGYSLGGNIVLKALGEWGDLVPREIDSAIAVSPPIDLIHCSWNLRQAVNRTYERYFMRRLRARLSRRRRMVKDLVDNGLNPLPDRLLDFDDQFVAPIFGFTGARDYYESCSAGPLLHDIRVPTIIVTSQDDPVVPFSMYNRFRMCSEIEMVATRHGGHLGFISQTSSAKLRQDPDPYWLDWRICQWLSAIDDVTDEQIARDQERAKRKRRHLLSFQSETR